MSNSYFLKTILHFMQFFQQYKSSIFQKLSFTKSYWEVNINERSSLESMFWFSHLCNYKCCIPGYINLVAKFLNFLKDFTPTLYNFFFFWLQQFVTMPSHAERQKKYLAKLKGSIGEDQYKEKESRHHILKRQENLDLIQEKDREWQKWYQEQKKAGKRTITSPAYIKLSRHYQTHQESAHR